MSLIRGTQKSAIGVLVIRLATPANANAETEYDRSDAADAPTIPNRGIRMMFAAILRTKAITLIEEVTPGRPIPETYPLTTFVTLRDTTPGSSTARGGMEDSNAGSTSLIITIAAGSNRRATRAVTRKATRDTAATCLSESSRADPATCGKKTVATAFGKKNTISASPTAML
jgi:hypothetical protein